MLVIYPYNFDLSLEKKPFKFFSEFLFCSFYDFDFCQNLAYSEFSQGNYESAINKTKQNIDAYPLRSDNYGKLAYFYAVTHHEDSLSFAEKSISMDPDNFFGNISLALHYIKQSSYSKAESILKNIHPKYHKKYQDVYYFTLASFFYEQNNLAEAKKKLDMALSYNKVDFNVLLFAFSFYFKINNIPESQKYYNILHSIDSANSYFLSKSVSFFLKKNQNFLAAQSLFKLVASDSEDFNLLPAKADYLFNVGEINSSYEAFKAYVSRYGFSRDFLLLFFEFEIAGLLYPEQVILDNQPLNSIGAFSNQGFADNMAAYCMNSFGKNYDNKFFIDKNNKLQGCYLLDLYGSNSDLETLNKVIGNFNNQNNGFYINLLTISLIYKHKSVGFTDNYLNNLLAKNPDNFNVINFYSHFYLKQGRYEMLEKIFNLKDKSYKNLSFSLNFVDYLVYKKEYDLAFEQLKLIPEFYYYNPFVLKKIMQVILLQNKLHFAEGDKKYLDHIYNHLLQSNDVDILYYLGCYYVFNKRYDYAYSFFMKGFKIKPDSLQLYDRLAYIFYKNNRIDLLLNISLISLKNNSNNYLALEALSDFSFKHDLTSDQVLDFALKYIENNKDNHKVFLLLAKHYAFLKKYDLASNYINLSLNFDISYFSISELEFVADFFASQGDTEKSEYYYSLSRSISSDN